MERDGESAATPPDSLTRAARSDRSGKRSRADLLLFVMLAGMIVGPFVFLLGLSVAGPRGGVIGVASAVAVSMIGGVALFRRLAVGPGH